ncbi:MAG TPA: carboxypeptidase regulatory-like domain-containing protein [Vicinamibacterales bacterium]|jgi:tetratricopeptide (TPR) repeat protein
MKRLALAFALLGYLAGAAAAAPPPLSGGIRGDVRNGVAQPLSAAEVTVDAQDGVTRHERTRTDASGRFALEGLPAGRYTITAQAPSLTPQSFDVIVLPGQTADVSFQLLVDPAAAYQERLAREAERQRLVASALQRSATSDFAGAVKQLRQSIALAPDCAVCYFELAEAQGRLGDPASAEHSYRQAIALNDEYAQAYGALASLYNTQHDFAQAVAVGTRAADLAERLAPDLAPLYRYNEGVYLWNAGRVDEARQVFEQVLRRDPGNADAHFELALALINAHDVAGAREHLEQYLKLAPTGRDAARARALLAGLGQ